MLRRDNNYVRLIRFNRSFLRQSSLWLGADHLLAVYVEAFTERYQRYSYRDIQAVVVCHTKTYLVLNIIWITLLGLLGLLALVSDSSARIAIAISAGAFGILLLHNLIGGPTCVCYLRTAVHTERLYGLNRLRKTRRAIAALKARIDQSQATVST